MRRWNRRCGLSAAGLAALVALCLLMAGCGFSHGQSTEGNRENADTGDGQSGALLEFSWYSKSDNFAPAPWGGSAISRWVEENKHVRIQWIPSGGEAGQQFNRMVTAGNLPDVIDLKRGADVERLVQSGSLVALDDFIDKYPNLRHFAGESTLNMLRSSDGKLYQFPIWYSPPGKSKGNGGYAIELKIYKSLGEPKLETFADLEDYLRLVKKTYPSVVPLELGPKFSGSNILYTGFGENKSTRYLIFPTGNGGMGAFPEGNRLRSIYKDPDYKEFVLYISRLYRDKLIAQDTFTQTKDQYLEKLNTGRAAVVLSADIANEAALPDAKLKALDPNDGYRVIWPIHKAGVDPAKVTVNSYDQLGSGVNVITKKAKDPERIFAFLDWMTGEEGQRIFWYGPPGLFYDKVDENGVPLPNDRFERTTFQEMKASHVPYINLVGNTLYIDTSKVTRDNMLPPDKRNFTIQTQSRITWRTSRNVTEFVNMEPPPDLEEGLIEQRVRDIYAHYFARIVFAQSDEDVLKLLQQASMEVKNAGQDKLLAYQTKQWRKNLTQLEK